MKLEALERYLKSFGNRVVKEAKIKLASSKGDTALGNSIRAIVVKTAQGFDTKFYMEDYGEFLDKGVSGNKNEQSYINTAGERL